MSSAKDEFENIKVPHESKSMVFITCANYIDELKEQRELYLGKAQDLVKLRRKHLDYIQALENQLMKISNDMAAFLLAENIKGPRLAAREKANDKK